MKLSYVRLKLCLDATLSWYNWVSSRSFARKGLGSILRTSALDIDESFEYQSFRVQ